MHVLSDQNGAISLELDSLIVARVAASNAQGEGDYSPVNTDGIRIQTIPQAPINAP
jgi:hypothetical protein